MSSQWQHCAQSVMANVAILISGNGTNLQAFIDADIPNFNIVTVISDNCTAPGLKRATDAGIPIACINADRGLRALLATYDLDLIILAGYMRILSDEFVNLYKNKIINIHPSLLPKYPGLNTHQRVLDAGDEEHGCTVHYVIKELDAGPIIAQETLIVTDWDTADMLKERVQKLEHVLYPNVVKTLIESRCKRAS